jgi:acyl carrier protein
MDASVGPTVRSFIVDNYLFGDRARMPVDDESLIETGVIDSTGVLELIEFLEESFGIAVEESETVPENLGSITGIEGYVDRKLGASGLAASA